MSYNKTKTDPELGLKVHEHLVKMGVETPMIKPGNFGYDVQQRMDRKEKIAAISKMCV
jgi:hypothetical protein